ncbi:hypothetical protein JKG47_11360 [Acidithiobacillus sp. MC6.1]|nr:hypothetical protein [Acidithiobacillus sp. MC6.1]
MAPIPEGSAKKERMIMAVQLPKPDYYTLAEVLKRWGISEVILSEVSPFFRAEY